MPIDGCFVCMLITIINSKLRGGEWDSVPYMMKVRLTHIPVECTCTCRRGPLVLLPFFRFLRRVISFALSLFV